MSAEHRSPFILVMSQCLPTNARVRVHVLPLEYCFVYLCMSVTKMLYRSDLRKHLFGLLASQGSVHDFLPSCVWEEHHGWRSIWQMVGVCFLTDRKLRVTKCGQGYLIPKTLFHVSYCLQLGSTSYSFPYYDQQLGRKFLNLEDAGNISH